MQHDTDTMHAPPEGVFSSVKNLAASFVSHLHARLQLFATEFAEEKHRQTSILFNAISALFFLFVAIVLAATFVIVAAWDTPYRLHVIGGLTLLFLMGAGIFWGFARAKLKSKPRLFQASLAELYKDWQQLSSK